MIMFKNGKRNLEYPDSGSRKADGLAIWVLKHTQPQQAQAEGDSGAAKVEGVNPMLKVEEKMAVAADPARVDVPPPITLEEREEDVLMQTVVELEPHNVWSVLMPAVYQLVPGSMIGKMQCFLELSRCPRLASPKSIRSLSSETLVQHALPALDGLGRL